MMTLHDLDFLRLLPQFMQSDGAVRGLAAGLDRLIPKLAAGVEKLSTWDHIDSLSENELDALAWELNILWYDQGATLAVKRELAKNSDAVYKKLGTKWAVENVVETYFGDGRVEEWWQYGGEPGHFRVISSNPSLSAEKFVEFAALVSNVKRASAKLDMVYIELSGELVMSAGAALHDVIHEQYTAKSNNEATTPALTGVVVDGMYSLIDTDGSTIMPEVSADGLMVWPSVLARVHSSGVLNFEKS